MNILLLSNSAPNYYNFFNAMAKLFANDSAKVVVAVDSEFSRKENKLDSLGFDIHDFSVYFSKHQTNIEILKKYSDINLNYALLSDFERAETYRIWGKYVNIEFYDKLKSALLTFFEELFEQYKINVILYENVSNAFSYFAFHVAKKNAAEYYGIGGSRLPNRFTVTSDPIADDATAKIFSEIRTGEIKVSNNTRRWANSYISEIENIEPDYMKTNGLDKTSLINRYLQFNRLVKLIALLRHAFDSRTKAFQIGNPLLTHLNLFTRNFSRRLKINYIKKLYQNTQQDEKFLLYPLHFHPESSTSILAGNYLNEYDVIRNIAFNLPEGVRLYVKDHISAWGYPSIKFYRNIRRLPNVRLLDPNAPTKQLIKDSLGVITLTSTVGYEALLLKTRVYLYGRVFYEFHKGVTRVNDPNDLHKLLATNMTKPIDWDDDYNNDFVCAYYQSTLPGSLNLMSGAEKAEISASDIYPKLKEFIRLNYPAHSNLFV